MFTYVRGEQRKMLYQCATFKNYTVFFGTLFSLYWKSLIGILNVFVQYLVSFIA